MQRNFNRQYRVRIGKDRSTGKEIGAINSDTGRALRCRFSVEIGESVSSNTGKINLWNLDQYGCGKRDVDNKKIETFGKINRSIGFSQEHPYSQQRDNKGELLHCFLRI